MTGDRAPASGCPYGGNDAIRAHTCAPSEGLDVDPELTELVREQPVPLVRLPYGGTGEAWLAARHADVKTVLGDPRFSRAAASDEDVPRAIAFPLATTTMLSMDPPQHSRLRRPAAKAFNTRRIQELSPRAQEIVDGLLDAVFEAGPPVDLTKALTWQLPITMMSELLGVPVADRDEFTAWVNSLLILTDPEQAMRARASLDGYLAGLIAQRRAAPVDDLISELVALSDSENDLDDKELVSVADSLLSAGYEATASQLGNFVYVLLTHPDHWRELVANPGLIPDAVEELSRFVPSSTSAAGFTRVALEDVELTGRTVRAGQAVAIDYTMANRDPDVFDHPDRLDFHRPSNPHLTFGYGAHFCIGAQLARMVQHTMLEALVNRLPGLRLAVPADQVPWRPDRLIRGVESLPVTW
ncbi:MULTISPECIES: cytochrome P450 [unclassified Streptomyces]|uniref:cytochrome P450 n=1 Tax=unclassified Streptomyces TaxID=2593676 RepID=UPI001F1085BE|nr:cytochrome P450 [Streptomyces sp. DASNCL29]